MGTKRELEIPKTVKQEQLVLKNHDILFTYLKAIYFIIQLKYPVLFYAFKMIIL